MFSTLRGALPQGQRALLVCARQLAALLLASHVCASAVTPNWGDPVNGLRLGVAVESEATLLVLLENSGSSNLTIMVGAESGNGVFYHVAFHAKDARGHVCEVLNLAGPGVVAGSLAPISIHLEPGQQYAIHLPMHKLICVEHQTDIPLDALLRRGYSVTAAFSVDAPAAAWAHILQPWLGAIRSGQLSHP